MQDFVNHMLAPYPECTRSKLGWPPHSKNQSVKLRSGQFIARNNFLDWMCKKPQTTLVDFGPGRCTGITQPCDASVQAPYQSALLEDVEMSTLTQIEKHANRITINDRIPILCNTSVWRIWPASQALKQMEMVQEVSCQHLRTAEDNTYLQVDMQANICRLRSHHFVHMQVCGR